jgi:hypothetical protein
MTERTSAWLIEWPEDDNNPVRWWNPVHGWMRDANKALQFARQTDAECYLSTMKFGLHLKVTEHIFVMQLAKSENSILYGPLAESGEFPHRNFP